MAAVIPWTEEESALVSYCHYHGVPVSHQQIAFALLRFPERPRPAHHRKRQYVSGRPLEVPSDQSIACLKEVIAAEKAADIDDTEYKLNAAITACVWLGRWEEDQGAQEITWSAMARMRARMGWTMPVDEASEMVRARAIVAAASIDYWMNQRAAGFDGRAMQVRAPDVPMVGVTFEDDPRARRDYGSRERLPLRVPTRSVTGSSAAFCVER